LSSSIDEENDNPHHGDSALVPQIWLTDATGAYPVRALCVGRDASAGNSQLLVQNVPLLAQEGLQSFLSFLEKGSGGDSLVSIRLEMGMIQGDNEKTNNKNRLVRLRLEDLQWVSS
jgi:hypothetical protein